MPRHVVDSDFVATMIDDKNLFFFFLSFSLISLLLFFSLSSSFSPFHSFPLNLHLFLIIFTKESSTKHLESFFKRFDRTLILFILSFFKNCHVQSFLDFEEILLKCTKLGDGTEMAPSTVQMLCQVRYTNEIYITLLFFTLLQCTLLYSTLLDSTLLFSTSLYCTLLSSDHS